MSDAGKVKRWVSGERLGQVAEASKAGDKIAVGLGYGTVVYMISAEDLSAGDYVALAADDTPPTCGDKADWDYGAKGVGVLSCELSADHGPVHCGHDQYGYRMTWLNDYEGRHALKEIEVAKLCDVGVSEEVVREFILDHMVVDGAKPCSHCGIYSPKQGHHEVWCDYWINPVAPNTHLTLAGFDCGEKLEALGCPSCHTTEALYCRTCSCCTGCGKGNEESSGLNATGRLLNKLCADFLNLMTLED